MMLRCPVCRADNNQGSQCRRCKADLSMLICLENQRASKLYDAKIAFLEQRYSDAFTALDQAEELRQGEDILKYRYVLLVLSRQFEKAFQIYGTIKKPSFGSTTTPS